MKIKQLLVGVALISIGTQPVLAQSDSPMSAMEQTKQMQKNSGMVMKRSMQGGSAPADARDPHAYSDGYDFGPIPRPRFADEQNFYSLLADRFEVVDGEDSNWILYDIQAWYGRDYNRLVIKAEGEVNSGTLEEASTELLWSRALATYWNTQLGLRYDSAEAADQGWLAFGFQGLAPYWFELDVTGYLGEEGRTALNIEAEYELLITQKLILQPRLETDIHGKNDRERGIGSGLSTASAGIRLRYEIWREFAPYVGVEWAGSYGDTADYARAAGQATEDSRMVAGLRFWF